MKKDDKTEEISSEPIESPQRREELRQLAEAATDHDPQAQRSLGLGDDSTPKRKKQLQFIRSLLESPPQIDFKSEPIPSNTTSEEIDDKRRELQYRLTWLRALIEMTEAELGMLDMADASKENESPNVPAEIKPKKD